MDYSYLNSEALNCRCCGGVLNVKSSLCVCDFCGTTNFVSSTASKYVNQLNRANKLRQEREFDKAARIYDIILKENAPTADILWLRTLCEYGIEYVPDPVSDKYFPTLHRISDESILKYHSYVEALALAEGEEKESLQKEAEHINTIQNEYLNIAANEAPYDAFICYKETDEETGEKTEDVELAATIYKDLTGRGYKVFFAKETLKTKLSIEYEPYIFAALKSSKAMIVLGTKAEYFMSVWVKNEWGRFLKLMQDDENKQMFFACDDPEKLPRAFATKQAQLLGNKNALKNLADNVEEFLKEKCKPTLSKEEMYERALSHLEAGDESATKEYADKMTAQYPNFAQGYWLRMLNTLKATPSTIALKPVDIYSDPDFYMAVNLAEGDLKEEYQKTADACRQNLNNQTEFRKKLREESNDFIQNYEETESGHKKNEILNKIAGFASAVDDALKKIRWSAAIGYLILVVGAYYYIFSMVIIDSSYSSLEHARHALIIRILINAPFIIAGAAVMLSYNLKVDIITTAICAVLLVIAAITSLGFLCGIANILPMVVFVFTTFNFNRYRNQMTKASTAIKEELEDLQKCLSVDSDAEMRKNAENLLEQYKEENKINTAIEIRETDYNLGFNKLDKIYESAVRRYTKYVDVSLSEDDFDDESSKKDSPFGIIAFLFGMIPVVGNAFLVIDILKDKYNEYSHKLAVMGFFITSLEIGILILMIDFVGGM